jgi:hypothetical protein
MRTLFWLLIVGVFALVAAPDTNLTGNRTGTFKITLPDGQTNEGSAMLVLKQNGSDIAGTVGPNEGEQHTITKGTINGDKIALLIEEDGRTIKFDLALAADHITGTADISHDGQTAKAKIDVTRAK